MMSSPDNSSPVDDVGVDQGGTVPGIPGENPGGLMPHMVHRRAKRIIPDDEKDDKYWDKRRRNNMAAKRSRANKRQRDVDICNRMNYLEEENALLRKELQAIKSRFNLPLEQSVLTPEDRAECLKEMKTAQASQAEGRALKMNGTDDVSSSSPGISSVSTVPNVGHQDDPDPRSGPNPGSSGHNPGSSGHNPGNSGPMNGQHKLAKAKEEHDVTESAVFAPNGPSVYGSFSPCMWVSGTTPGHTDFNPMPYSYPQQHPHQHQRPQHPQQQQQQQQQHHQNTGYHQPNRQGKLPLMYNAIHDKPPVMPSMYGWGYSMAPTSNNGVTTSAGPMAGNQYGTADGRMPYNYCMAAAYSQGQAIYSPAHTSPNIAAAYPDLSLAARGPKPHQQEDTSMFLDKSSLPDKAQIPQSMANSHSHSALAQQRHRGMAHLMAASTASLGQPQHDLTSQSGANSADSLVDGATAADRMGQKKGQKQPSNRLLSETEVSERVRNFQERMDRFNQ